MKILFITYQGDMAGSTQSIAMLARALAAKGHLIGMACRKESLLYSLLQNSKVKLIPMDFSGKFDIHNMRQIRDAVNLYGFQVINAQSSWDRYSSIFARWIFGLNVKVVHTRRQKPMSVGGLQSWLYNKGADGFVAVSQGVAKALIDMGLNPKKVKVIPNGTPAEKYQNLNAAFTDELRNRLCIGKDDFVIGCISRKKQQEQIIEALYQLEFPCKLILVGIVKDSLWDSLIDRLPKQHQVFFEGEVDSSDVLNYYPLFNLKILASDMEGLSQSLLEAMALGVPVIATNAAGNPDLVKHNQNGLLFPDGDIDALAKNIQKLYSDSLIRNKLIEAGKRTAFIDFSLERTVLAYEAYFEELI